MNSACCLKAFHSPTSSALSQLEWVLPSVHPFYSLSWTYLTSWSESFPPLLTPCHVFKWVRERRQKPAKCGVLLIHLEYVSLPTSITVVMHVLLAVYQQHCMLSLCTTCNYRKRTHFMLNFQFIRTLARKVPSFICQLVSFAHNFLWLCTQSLKYPLSFFPFFSFSFLLPFHVLIIQYAACGCFVFVFWYVFFVLFFFFFASACRMTALM